MTRSTGLRVNPERAEGLTKKTLEYNKAINPPFPPFSLRPRAVSLRAGDLYEPEADPEGKRVLGGF
ncbi:MAG: hypothetical protein COZ69_06225 [Deltaproteobacteria bacterium CG_4_8_14_3_um_filter_45_9]|nr:MAG: hypothetical protein COZ69_06225 [Deltaproteobacteria bacterium CG_4_8_14_3_um_filter_45_9]